MADSGTPTSNEALDLNEIASNDELFAEATELAYKKMDLLEEKAALETANMSPDNPEFALTAKEIELADQEIDAVAERWADKHVWDVIQDPEKRAQRIEVKKQIFLNRLERKIIRAERKADRLDRRDARRAKRAARRGEEPETDPKRSRHERAGRKGRGGRRDENPSTLPEGYFPQRRSAGMENGALVLKPGTDALEEENSDNALIVKDMLAASPALSPSNLVEGARQAEAIDVVYASQPALAASLKRGISQAKGSPEYEDALFELSEMKAELDGTYNFMKKTDALRDQVDRSTIEGTLMHKLKDLGGAFIESPTAMVAAAGVLFGLWMLKDQLPTGTIKKVLGYGALGAAGVFTLDFIWENLDAENRGLFDRFADPNNLVAGKILKDYKEKLFVGMPTEDQDTIKDMIRILDAPIATVNDTFEQALNEHKVTVDSRSFLGHGVDSSAQGKIDDGSLYTGLRWFYEQCADRAMLEPGARQPSDPEDKLRMGLQWSKENLKGHTFESANIKVNIEPRVGKGVDPLAKGASTEGAALSAATSGPSKKPELLIQNTHLREFTNQEPAFHSVLRQLPGGEVAINGYPYQYYFTDRGDHRFVDALHPEHVYIIPAQGERGERNRLLSALTAEAGIGVKKEFATYIPGASGELRYRPESGDWALYPPLERVTHLGLAHTKRETKVPFVFSTDGKGMVATYDGAAETAKFNTLEEVQKDFELKKVLPALVRQDLNHLLLDMDFTVDDCTENAADKSTVITIRYDSGHEGTLTYKDDVLTGAVLSDSADLTARWEKEARKDTVSLFSRPVIQDRIVHVLGIAPELYIRWNNTMTSGIVSSEPNLEFKSGVFGTIGKTFTEMFSAVINSNDISGDKVAAREKDETEALINGELGTLMVTMHTELTALSKRGLSKTEYEVQKKALMDGYEVKINEILAKKQDLTLPPEDVARMKSVAESKIAEALYPMKHYLSTDGNQEALYKERLIYWQHKTVAEITALGATPKKSEVDRVIAENFTAASTEANDHRGLSATQSAEVLDKAKLNGVHKADWEAPTAVAFTYLSNNFKWEQYSFLSKRENLSDLMDLYYQKIEYGNLAATPDQAKKYVENYFLSTVYVKLGGKEDFSMDRFYAQLNAVSDTQYQAVKADLMLMKPFRAWVTSPEVLTPPPELNDDQRLEQDKDLATAGFLKDFDEHIQLKKTYNPFKLEFWDHNWPEYWRRSVEGRLTQIRAARAGDPTYTAEKYREELKDYRKFVVMEHNVFQLMVQHRIEPKDKGAQMEEILNGGFDIHWPTRNYVGYFNELAYKVYAPDQDWWPEWNDSVIVEAHDGFGLEKLFNVPFV